jgi:hypothetical protein
MKKIGKKINLSKQTLSRAGGASSYGGATSPIACPQSGAGCTLTGLWTCGYTCGQWSCYCQG